MTLHDVAKAPGSPETTCVTPPISLTLETTDEAQQNSSESGFALVVVIWVIGLITLLFTTYIGAARYHSIEAFSLAERTQAESVASKGVTLAIIDLLATFSAGADQSARFGAAGDPVFCRMNADSVLAIAVFDEGGKVDLNAAEPELLEAVVRGVATAKDGVSTADVVNGILGLRKKAAASADTQNPGPTMAFRSVFELDHVPGMSASLRRTLIPLVTVHSRSPGVNPQVASPELLNALTSSQSRPRGDVPSYFIAEVPGRVFAISTEARTVSGVRFARDAIVEFSTKPLRYRVREWRDGSMRRLEGLGRARLAPC